jgi:hypothetical protein
LIVVGGFLLLDNLGLLAFDFWSILGPGLLVALGLWIMLSRPMRVEAVEGENLTIPLQGELSGFHPLQPPPAWVLTA